jgi:hypothetical protein
MYALVVRVTIHNADRTREVLNSQVVPQVSGARGFKTGYWTWSTGGGALNGLSMIIFESEENARAAGERIKAVAESAPDDVTLDGTEVREVVASAWYLGRRSAESGRRGSPSKLSKLSVEDLETMKTIFQKYSADVDEPSEPSELRPPAHQPAITAG